MNRRRWLSLVLASSASTLIAPRGWGAIGSGVRARGAGLFFDPARLEQIRQHYLQHPEFADLRAEHAQFDYAAETAWMEHTLRYNDQLFDIARLGGTAVEQAFVYLMTGDERAEAMARRAVEEIMKFPRWDFFLDGDLPIAVQRASQSTVAVSLVIDFLGDRLSRDERRVWLETMQVRGTEACYRTVEDIRHPRSVTGWRFDPESTFFEHRPGNRTDMNRRPEITYNTNLRAVPASALVIGAIAYEREFGASEKSQEHLAMGIWGMEDFRQFFQSDGSYDEENNYAHYTALHLLQAVIALRRHGGIDLTDLIDWDAYTDYLYNTVMPTEANPWAVVNWGDSGSTPEAAATVKRSSLPFWIARETGNPLAQGFAKTLGGHHDLWAALWFDPSVPAELPPHQPQLWISDLDRVVARTGYGVEHLVVAMRSGPPANHEHADRNSLIVKCFGQELITDPLRPAYSYSDPAWRMRLTEGHSAILIDGRGHDHHNGVEGTNPSTAYARIVEHDDGADSARWVSDATQPYRLVDTDIKSVVRSVAVLYGLPAVVVVDRITKWKTPSSVQARFYGYNWDGQLDISAGEDRFLIRRPGAVLRAQTFATHPLGCETGQMEELAEHADRHPFVDVRVAPAVELTLVTVMALAKDERGLPLIQGERAGDDFAIRVGGFAVRVRDGLLSLG